MVSWKCKSSVASTKAAYAGILLLSLLVSPLWAADSINGSIPDPKKIGNCGSFFKNPLIESKKLDELLKKHPQLPYHKNKNELYKIPAAWLIEKMGFKQKSLGNVGVYINQPLVIVNNGNANGSDILNFANSIKDSVKKEP